jgi:hypothetical protein
MLVPGVSGLEITLKRLKRYKNQEINYFFKYELDRVSLKSFLI